MIAVGRLFDVLLAAACGWALYRGHYVYAAVGAFLLVSFPSAWEVQK